MTTIRELNVGDVISDFHYQMGNGTLPSKGLYVVIKSMGEALGLKAQQLNPINEYDPEGNVVEVSPLAYRDNVKFNYKMKKYDTWFKKTPNSEPCEYVFYSNNYALCVLNAKTNEEAIQEGIEKIKELRHISETITGNLTGFYQARFAIKKETVTFHVVKCHWIWSSEYDMWTEWER